MSYKTVNWNELFYTLTDVDKLNKSVKKKILEKVSPCNAKN